ncbi:MAG: hypothetical protein KBD64_03200 [Gammaproteobacteria bacterium]|nr:hypothetical protein [Gammaproteobacteria bacterium]
MTLNVNFVLETLEGTLAPKEKLEIIIRAVEAERLYTHRLTTLSADNTVLEELGQLEMQLQPTSQISSVVILRVAYIEQLTNLRRSDSHYLLLLRNFLRQLQLKLYLAEDEQVDFVKKLAFIIKLTTEKKNLKAEITTLLDSEQLIIKEARLSMLVLRARAFCAETGFDLTHLCLAAQDFQNNLALFSNIKEACYAEIQKVKASGSILKRAYIAVLGFLRSQKYTPSVIDRELSISTPTMQLAARA